MSNADERSCVRCSDPEDSVRLERCVGCGHYFCTDCAYRSTGRRFCSVECARAFFYGDGDDDDDDAESPD